MRRTFARSDAGATDVDESVENRGETDGEGERARRREMVWDEGVPYDEFPENPFVNSVTLERVGEPNLGQEAA